MSVLSGAWDWLTMSGEYDPKYKMIHNMTPQAVGAGQAFEPIKTTTIIGYVIAAGVTIYLTRKVFAK